MPNIQSQTIGNQSPHKGEDPRKRQATTVRHRPVRQPHQRTVTPLSREGQRSDQRDLPTPAEATTVVLPHGDFREVDWAGVILNGCDATGANFSAAMLADLCALGANLTDVQFEEAELQNAALCGANLTQANLRNADLRNANLTWCNLRGATLLAGDLRGANLAWADLRDADLRHVNLKGAYYNVRTQWPTGFDPAAAQMLCLAESR